MSRHGLTYAAAIMLLLAAGLAPASAQPVERLLAEARQERPALLDTLAALVAIESGSRDIEGLDRLADLIAARLKALGGDVALVEPSDVYRMEDTPERIGRMVRATFAGIGTKKILLIGHMDTVYQHAGQAAVPHRRQPRLRPRDRR